jgi:hypothetical protein
MKEFLSRALAYTGVPYIIDSIYDYVVGDEIEEMYALPRQHKKYDSTKFTQYQYDFIQYAHAEWKEYNKANKGNRKTALDLTDVINERMQTDKGVSTLSRVWNKKIDRSALATGESYFDY